MNLQKKILTFKLCQKVLMGFLLSLGSLSVFAQTTYTIGTGTVSNSNFPIASCFGYTYSQQIYGAGQLTGQGAGQGTLTKIRFYVASTASSSANSNNWKVYIGHTTKTNFSNTADWENASNLQLCYSGIVSIPGANNWMEITFTTPFEWNGTSNLMVAVEEEQPNYNCTYNWRGTTYAANRGLYYRNDSNNPSPATPPTGTGMSTTIPNIQFEHIPAPVCAGEPAAGTTLATVTDVCPNGSTVLSATSNYFEAGMSRQWQINDGTGWVDVPGATGPTLSQSNLTDTIEYQMIVTCANSGLSTATTPITINLQEPPVVTLNLTSVAACLGDPAMLIASGANTYSWSPASGLDVAIGDTVYASPVAISNYTVIGTSEFGCVATVNPTVNVTPVTLAQGTISYNPTVNCSPNSPVTIVLNDLPATITNSGTWETRWLDADSVTVLQDWSASNTFNFIPTSDAVYGHFYQIRSTSCPTDYVDSVYTSIAVGFGAEANLTHYDCNTMGGTIALFDVFGQPVLDTVFVDTLNTANSMLVLTGNAAFNGGRVELTPSATSKSGTLTINPVNFTSGINNSMNFKWKMTADQPIVAWGFNGADGMAFSFGNDAIPTGIGASLTNGKGSKLRLSFDAAGNVGGNVAGIYLTYGFNAVDMAPTSEGVLAYSPNQSLWKVQTDIPVEISISTDAKVTVTVNGVVVFQDIQLPASFKNENVSTWKHLFSAQTGAAALRQAVKEYVVESNGVVYGITAGGSAIAPSTWQNESSFTDLVPGTYDVWMSQDGTGTCEKNIGTFEILNQNPVVELGNDTTICEGSSILLDAGNVGGVYLWSNSQSTTQTITASEAGNYVVNVIDTVGCQAIGTINVDVLDVPSASGIFVQGSFPTLYFSVLNAENTATYSWDFGDGTTLNNAPSSVSHTYAVNEEMVVVATLTNDCGSVEITETVDLDNDASVFENSLQGLSIYPNPTRADFTVSLEEQNSSEITVFTVTGALVFQSSFIGEVAVSTQNWEKGIYFVQVSNGGITSTQKVVVQ